MSPFEITLLLHIYACLDRFPQDKTPGYKTAVEKLKREGLIREFLQARADDEHRWALTERGELYVQMLKDLKPPVASTVWLDENGKEVVKK